MNSPIMGRTWEKLDEKVKLLKLGRACKKGTPFEELMVQQSRKRAWNAKRWSRVHVSRAATSIASCLPILSGYDWFFLVWIPSVLVLQNSLARGLQLFTSSRGLLCQQAVFRALMQISLTKKKKTESGSTRWLLIKGVRHCVFRKQEVGMVSTVNRGSEALCL